MGFNIRALYTRITIWLLLSCFSFSAVAQDIIMSDGVVSQCGGNFFDSGGDLANYSNNESFVYTICSDQPGKCVQLTFQSFILEKDFDFLYIYNGSTTGAPLIGTYTGTNSPGVVTATSGCLTIKFTSDYTVNKPGWKAIIGCVNCPVNNCPTCNGGSPPANDACSGAENLGQLPLPQACPVGIGAVAVFNTSNLCATAEVPYNAMQGCKPVGNMTNPAADVWYKFTLTAPILNITINGMNTPQVGLYSGTSCNTLIPRGCAIGGGGTLNTTFGGLAAGTYFLQVSGGTISDQCNFTLSLQNNFDCSGCVTQSTLSVNPPPVNGIYLAGQQVTFCLNITDFNPTSSNWLHGVVPSFGPGWDLSTLVAMPPTSCSGNGTWSWYNNPITSTANNQTFGPGFFFESASGNINNVVDTNPGNNFGDNIGPNCNINFCWRINTLSTANCIFGANLNVLINTFTDGESGSWTSSACSNDPVHDLYATLACCIPPSVNITQPLCYGNQGSATGTGNGSGPWKYFWKNAASVVIQQNGPMGGSSNINNLPPGIYYLTTEDINGCQSTTLFAIVAPQQLTANLTTVSTKCALNNGAISITAQGGTSPYTYSNNGGVSFQSNNEFKNLAAGNYTIVVKDNHNCSVSLPATIDPSTIPAITSIVHQDVSCYNGSDGSITLGATGGTAPYTFQVNNGSGLISQSQNVFNNLPFGVYQVSVIDVFGCKDDSTVILNQPPVVNLISVPTPSDCNLNNGIIQLTVTGSFSGTLLYSIDKGLTFQPTDQFTNLSPGIYFIQVEDGNGCLVNDTVIVNTINAPKIDSLESQNLTCYHSADGEISVYGSGGVGSLLYSIDGGTSFGVINQFNSLTANSYHVVIKDNNDCRVNKLAIVTEPSPIIIKADVMRTSCGLDNGLVSLHPANGVAPLQYSMDGGATWTFNNIFTGLPSGNVTFQVEDANGCTAPPRTYNILPSTSPVFSDIQIQNVLCTNTNTGIITIITADGTPPILYSIDGGLTTQSVNTFTNLIAGSYSLRLKDDIGCVADSVITLSQPPALTLSSSAVNTTCSYANGSIDMTGSGGVVPYQYSIDGGITFSSASTFTGLISGTYKIVIRDANNCEKSSTVTIDDAPGPRITGSSYTPQICDGINNASVSITAVSGTGALMYSADSGMTYVGTMNILNLAGGDHTLIVMDQNQCADTVQVTIPVYHSPIINAVNTADPLCFGDSNGNIVIQASGGNGTLQYSIDNGLSFFSSPVFSQYPAASYIVVVKDTNQCTAVDTVALYQPDPLAVQTTITNETCLNSNGTIALSTTGGTPLYLFSLNGASSVTDSVFNQLNAGNYTIQVTDLHNCTATLAVNIQSLVAPVINAVQIQPLSCYQSADGSITVAGTGNGNLQYSLDGIIYQTSPVFSGLAAATYHVYVKDTNNCVTDTILTVSEPDAITASIQTQSSNCTLANGAVTVMASGGAGSLLFSLNNGPFTSATTFSNLVSGNYQITIQDANGCMQNFNASVSSINGAVINSILTTDVLCNGNLSGGITIQATGGTGPLSYSIDNGTTTYASGSFNNLAAGNYNIVVADTVGCVTTASAVILQPDVLTINQSITPATCGQNNGVLQFVVTGGTGSYLYSLDSVIYQSSSVFSSLPAGTYQIYVKDGNNCSANGIISLPNLSAPVIQIAVSGNITCNGGTDGFINLTATGGTGLLQYSIDQGVNYQSSSAFSSLAAGNYQIRIKDENNCTVDTLITLTQPPPIGANFNITGANCQQSNGSLDISASGGTGSLLYSLNNSVFSPQNIISNLAAGSYTLDIKDIRSCVKSYTIIIPSVSGPVLDTIIKNDLICNGIANGSLLAIASGGSGNLLFNINNGIFGTDSVFNSLAAGNYTVTVKDSAGCINAKQITIATPPPINVSFSVTNPACGQANGDITIQASGGSGVLLTSINNGAFVNQFNYAGLLAGTYLITVRDTNGCVNQKSVSLSNLLAPSIVNIQTKNIKCFNGNDGEIKITAVGGTGALNYSIDNGNNFITGTNFTQLTSGAYQLAVVDQNNCRSDSVIYLSQPDSLHLSIGITPETCSKNNGIINLQATGGTVPYLFSIDSTHVYTPANSFINRTEGWYYIAVKDNHQCTKLTPVFLPDLTGPDILSLNKTNISCFGAADGSVSITTSGGNGNLLFSLNNFSTSQTGQQFIGLNKGAYIIYVKDTNNCIAKTNFTISEPTILSGSDNIIAPLCNGSSDGSVTVTPSGGIFPYTIEWNNGSSNFNLASVASGNYSYIISDANNCQYADSLFVNQPLSLAVTDSIRNSSCSGGANGLAILTVSGGTSPYQYQWSPNSGNTYYATSLAAGNYQITITDAHGCVLNHSLQINAPIPLANTFTTTDVSCYGGSDGALTANVNGGTSPYSYAWSNGQSGSSQLSGLTVGVYTATVTDANGCSSQFTGQITSPAQIKPDGVINNTTCYGYDNGMVTLNVTGGVSPYTYLWSNSSSVNPLDSVTAGVYVVTVTDAHGCTKIRAFTVNQPTEVVIQVSPDDTLCIGQQTMISCTASGGTGGYIYYWNNNQYTSGISVSPSTTQVYYIYAEDSNQCRSATDSISVFVFPPLNVTLTGSDTICSGQSVTLTANPSGGNGGPYYYLWSDGSQQATATVYPAQTGSVSVVVTDQCTVIPAADSVPVHVYPTPQIDITPLMMEGCMPLSVEFSNQSVLPPGTILNWNFGDGNTSDLLLPVNVYQQAGVYSITLTATTPQQCVDSVNLTDIIQVYPLPVASFAVQPEKVNILHPEISIVDSSKLAVSWYYNFGDGEQSINQFPSHTYADTGKYEITQIVTTEHGCTDTTMREIVVEGVFTLYIPNAFTPNQDGHNDEFFATGYGITAVNMLIFNRWGNKVFETNLLNGKWNGQNLYNGALCAQGVYVYTMKVTDQFGVPHTYQGQVTLIR